VGTPTEVRLHLEGFAEEPHPEVAVADPAQGSLELIEAAPQVSTAITIINGQVSQRKEVRFVYRYRYLSMHTGSVEIGPFVVTQKSVQRTAPAVRLELRDVPLSDRLRVLVRLPEEPGYVGQRIPVTLEIWLEPELQTNLHSYTLRAPVFELGEAFQFVEEPSGPGGLEMTVETATGRLSVTHALVPLRAGHYPLDPATLVVRELEPWPPARFGAASGGSARQLRATDVPRTLEVRPIPGEGRPASFAGAVGRGFTLEVSADRTIVGVGDPITLSFTLRGEGNLETAGLPALDAEGLLPAGFRVPEGDLAGDLEDGSKRFSAVVRVRDADVDEIPPLAYAWFDPELGRYETTHTQPIALSVSAAEVIAADDVLRAEEETAAGARRAEASAARAAEQAAPFSLSGADLAIERDPRVVLRDPRTVPGRLWLPAGLYLAGVLVLVAALADRRRREVDPTLARRRDRLREEVRHVRQAVKLPAEEAVAELARSLRRMLAEVPEARAEDLDTFLEECDARSYAPDRGGDASLDETFRARALALATALEERAR
jgi:hypothetical protein